MRITRLAALLLAALCLNKPGLSADFEIGPQDNGGSQASSSTDNGHASRGGVPEGLVPAEVSVWLDAGDVPTAYSLKKYELRADFRFYDQGGILGKAYLGLFDRFFLGGAADLRNFVGTGDLRMTRDDAQLLARLTLLQEDDALPAVAVGWDGPAYEHGEAKGLYVAMSKEVPTSLCYIQFHAGVNSADIESFVATRDLRAFAAATTAFRNVGIFTSVDEVLHSVGSRWSAGIEGHFEPITLGLEFRDLASPRPNTPVSRLLRVAWVGRF